MAAQAAEQRTYHRGECIVFLKTHEAFGGLSNMASGYPLFVNGIRIHTSEALYQACRFPHLPDVQRKIIGQASPMSAKMVGKPFRKDSRPDWDAVRVNVMRWCLRVKLAQNWERFGELLLSTDGLPIVEESRKDQFWGAKPVDEDTLVGTNVLGRLLMELREQLKGPTWESLRSIEPMRIPNFALLGRDIGRIECSGSSPLMSGMVASSELHPIQQLVLTSPSHTLNQSESVTMSEPVPHVAQKPEPNVEAPISYRKKLIEVALPLEAINTASVREGYIYKGNPSAIHKWWAQRPLAACRAVLFAQMVDDPSSLPEEFPTEEAQEAERQRLFAIITDLVKWENTTEETVLHKARVEIARSAARNHNVSLPHSMTPGEVADALKRYAPPVLDPFAGGGSIPLEAQRLGLQAHASDLNPVAVLINKALIEIPPKFAGRRPVNPGAHGKYLHREWKGAEGLADDIRYYGQWTRDEAWKRIGYLYPKVQLPQEQGGGEAAAIAWLWAHTVTCPNPACGARMPLVRSLALSTKKGKEVWVEPVVDRLAKSVRFEVRHGKGAPEGTVSRAGARCVVCGSRVPLDHVRAEGRAGSMGMQMMAIVVEGKAGRVYVPPSDQQVMAATIDAPENAPDTDLPEQALGFRVQGYGMTKHRDLFTSRQLVAMTTFSDLVSEAGARALADAAGDAAYADAIETYLAFASDKYAPYGCALVPWFTKEDRPSWIFGRQTLSMVWDFAEVNPFSDIGGSLSKSVSIVADSVAPLPDGTSGEAIQRDAASPSPITGALVSTDPPYYDNVPYADLSDFFYVWLRRALRETYPELFATRLVPKEAELVADPHRYGGKSNAEHHFVDGIRTAFASMREASSNHYPLSVYYAFKQAEEDEAGEGEAANGSHKPYSVSTGWEVMLEGLVRSQLAITGTWPMRTERAGRLRDSGSNALASSIVLVCRPRAVDAPLTTRRDFLQALHRELPHALRDLQRGHIAPVDLAQAAIGPGMAVFSRYSKVLESDGTPMSVRIALQLINQALDEVLAEQEGEYDSDTRWAVAWFEQYGMEEGPYGVAETLSKAKNTSVEAMRHAGIVTGPGGKVRLVRRDELPEPWSLATARRLTAWEVTQRLIRALETEGEQGAAAILDHVGALGEIARDLAYRLYTVCERKKWADEALAYNSLVVEWTAIAGAVEQVQKTTARQTSMF